MITTQMARAEFTKRLIDVYQERIRPKGFLRSFFPSVYAPTLTVSIEVERGFEKIAADVLMGTEGNRNTFSKSTEKIFEPPTYREYFNATNLDLYQRVLGSQRDDNTDLFVALMNSVGDRLGLLQDKIERSLELQCAQVLQTGIIELSTATIDYKRKAASMVDLNGAGGYFTANSQAFDQLGAGAEFLRTKGKCTDFTFDVVMGAGSFEAFLKNTVVLARQNLFNMSLDTIGVPQASAIGAVYHGIVTGGPYRFRIWTYPEFYDDAETGVSTQYIEDDMVIILPSKPRFKMAHALVPQLIDKPGTIPSQAAWVYGEFMDDRKAVHDFDVQTRALAIPVAVDQIYTMKAIA